MRLLSLRTLPERPKLPPGLSVRTLRPDEEKSLAALLNRAYEDERWDRFRVRTTFIDDPSVRNTFVLAGPRGLLATASLQIKPDFPDSGWIHWVATDPSHRRKGFGSCLVIRVLEAIAEMGFRDAMLDTQEHRLPAVAMYRKLGFILSEGIHRSLCEKSVISSSLDNRGAKIIPKTI